MLRNKENTSIKNTSTVFKSGLWFTVCNIITKGVGFFTTPIFTRLLTKAEFGDFNNYSTWTGIVVLVTSLNLGSSLISARYEFKDDLDRYVASMICLSVTSTLLWLLLFLIFIEPIEEVTLLKRTEIYAMFLYLLFYPAIELFQIKERFEYRYKRAVAVSLLMVVSTSLLSVFLVLWLEDNVMGRIIGNVLPVITIGAFISFFFIRKAKNISIRYWKYALPVSLPFIPHLLSMNLLGSMDKVMIKQMCGSEDLALYSLAYTVGTIISLFVNSMNSAFSPWLGEQLSRKKYRKIRRVSIPYVAFFLFFSFILVLITPEILVFMGGEGYLSARILMPQISAGCLMQFIYTMYVNIEQFERKTIGMAFASIISVLFNYMTNYIFLLRFGYVAASYTTFFSYFLLMALHLYLVKRIGRSCVFNNKIILILAVVGSIALFGLHFIIEYTAIRYLIIIVLTLALGGFMFTKKNHILNYILSRK